MADAGERQRFETAVLPHLDAAYNLARWMTRSPDEAVDIVQDATLRAWRFFDGFRGGDAKPWFLRIVRNAVLSAYERQGGANVVPFSALEREDGSSPLDDIAAPGGDPEGALLQLEDRAEVERHLAGCPACSDELARLQTLRTTLRAHATRHRLPADARGALLASLPTKDPPIPAAVRSPNRR